MTEHSDAVSLKEHVEARIAALEKATELAARALDKRLDSMNEFRQQLREQNQTFLTKAEYAAHCLRTDEDIRFLRESRAKLEGKADASALQNTTVLAIAALVVGICSLLIDLFG